MQKVLPSLTVQVLRGRSELLVRAREERVPCRVTLTARFSGLEQGVSLELTDDKKRTVLDRAQISHHPAIAGVMRLIADEVELGATTDGGVLEHLFRCLFVYCSRMNQTKPLAKWGRVVRDPRIERAVEILNRDIAKRWTVELLAKAVGLSRPVLARQFIAVLGLSPMRYLTQRRMQRAAALLFAGDEQLTEVASRVGYQSEFAFNRAFRRHFGVPPGQYRKDLASSVTTREVIRMAA
jgi:AraC-like DNA-binding protein